MTSLMGMSANRKRPTLLKCRKNQQTRISFSYERVNLHSILNRDYNMTPTSRAARNITRRERKLRFRSRGVVIDITPLSDKPRGRIRMPVSPVDNNGNQSMGDVEVADKENCDLAATLLEAGPSLSQILFSKQRDRNDDLRDVMKPIANLPFASEFHSALKQPSISELTESMTSIEQTSAPNVANLWSADELDAYELGRRCVGSCQQRTELWSTLFSPSNKSEIFNNTVRVYNWFEAWYKRLSTRTVNEPPTAKRKRRSVMYEYDSDEDYECPDVDLPNPLVISGPSGCGKTSTVYCAAQLNKMRVLEFAPSERRNGASLEKKLSGAIESHYVQSNRNCVRKDLDIRQMFSPCRKNKADTSESSSQFSVALIDDCDVIFSTDDNFWSTIKGMFDEAKIPIVLTCTNYDYVKKKLSSDVGQSEWVQYVPPTLTRLSRQLRPWVAGFSQKLITPKWLRHLIESRRGDVRGVLNELHYQVSSGRLQEIVGNNSAPLSLKSHAHCAYALAELDAAYGVNVSPPSVSWRAKELADLDYCPNKESAYKLGKREFVSEEQRECVMEALKPVVSLQQFFSFRSSRKDEPPLKVLRDAWMRSLPGMAIPYSWRAVGTDYMPCLEAIDQKFKRENRERFNRSTTDLTRRQARSAERERTQHPFDDICSANCEAIDKIGGLRLSIGTYAFSNVYHQMRN